MVLRAVFVLFLIMELLFRSSVILFVEVCVRVL